MVIGMAHVLEIEARAILEGLKLAWMRGFRQVEVESDNALLIDSIRNGFVANREQGLSWSVWAQDGNHHVAVRNLVSSHRHRRPWGRFPPLTSNSVPIFDFDSRL
ncbi:hypothetical protein J1N35_012291 [Gossypium stocksii]|uniref:RNase H type-1 domain-containing protein n=1 Tax=Gossypium stocksii TaxID=47602 RepID=A0A9D4AE78_9ROSI|nr:hypothetical protein J1N35_012291 [Gossypium stocksii]